MSSPFVDELPTPVPSAVAVADGRVAVAAATDVGPVRKRNEDAALVPGLILGGADRGHWSGTVSSGPRTVLQVIDGMGAHGGGSVASVLTALAINEFMAELPRPEVASMPDSVWVGEALQRTCDLVVDVGALNPRTQIMGAATAGIVIGATGVLVFHVGDCRCYVVEDGYLTLMTADHRSRAGGLTRSVGGTGKREVIVANYLEMDRAKPRRYLLCSDGLTDTLDFEAIKIELGAATAESAVAGLIAAAVAAGSHDNVTVIVADVPMC